MASAGWLPQQRPELFRTGAILEDDRGPVTRFLDWLRPDEGFAGLGLVLLLAGITAWSISDARWILGRDGLTDFLIPVALAATLWSWLMSRFSVSPWIPQTLGAVVGAVVLIELVGMRIPNATPGLLGWAQATAYSATQAYMDLTWRHKVTTLQYGHFCLVLGILVWGTAQSAAYSIFGYRRSVNGVLLLAVVFVANMALTAQDQFQALVIFCSAALVLLILSHAADERANWLTHRIWRGRDFRAPNMQGGLAFASLAVVASLVLTSVASSAPLKDAASDMDLQHQLSWLSGLLPAGGQSRLQNGSLFSPTFVVGSQFKAGPDNQFTIHASSGNNVSYHWRVMSYDFFKSNGWGFGPTTTSDIVAGTGLDRGTQDLVGATTPGRAQVTLTVHVQNASLGYLIAADEPDSVNVGVTRTVIGSASTGWNVASYATKETDYVVSVYAPNIDPAGSGLTEWQLENAGTKYPAGLLARYTQGTDLVGTDGRALLAAIKSWAIATGNKFDNEYDVAKAMQAYLRSPDEFKYTTDISAYNAECADLSTVDCFAVIKQGFCEQYATTMTMLMRMAGYPARFVLGFLPGTVSQNTFIEQVTSQQTHSWVEVYFPTYGWIPFDPTGGPGRPTLLPAGQAVKSSPTPTAGPSESDETAAPTHKPDNGDTAATTTPTSGPAPLVIPAIFAILLALVLFVTWRRRPLRLEQPETVMRNIVWLATRLGYKPTPTQTVYEYTGMLADIVPAARDPLGVVATAAVEVQYGKRKLSTDQLTLLARAQRSVQGALVRLALRVPRLRRKR